jgi:hypothetical protein
MHRSFQIGSQNHASRHVWVRLAVAFVGGLLLGAAVALFSPGSFLTGWLAASLLSIPSLFFLLSAWSWAGAGRLLGWMIALTFLLRLVIGIGLSLAIAEHGYDNECQNAGYLFKDACQRDREAFSIAHKTEGLYWGSGIQLDNDQYGGLAFLSGWIYRYLSPDAHRPFLILIIGSFFAALGVPFLRQVLRMRWNDRVANIAAWIYILYPDAIFFGSSQMREPMLVGLGAVAFWAVLSWKRDIRTSALVFAASFLGMFFFSTRVALLIGGILFVWFWLDFTAARSENRQQIFGWIGLGLGMLILFVLSWNWFRSSSGYDVLVTIKSSGQAELRIKEIGEQWKYLFSLVYGVARPVLPAAIADSDSLPLLRAVGIIRSAGWYILVPFLAYGVFTLWLEPDPQRRRLALWLILTFIVWLLVASARGGGDATDNPRYRSLFIPWIALLAAWSVDWALSHRAVWLWCWVIAEFIFVGFFTHWYLARYYKLWVKLPFWEMVIWIAGLGGLILIGGWVFDRFLAGKFYPRKTSD